jgi:flagellar motor switch protein FliN
MSQDDVSRPTGPFGAGSPFEDLAGAAMPRVGEAAGAGAVAAEIPLASLFDLTLPISIELGRTSMMVQEVLQLGRGSVIELDRLAGEPVDVFVGDRRFAEGEVVVLGENFGVRITRILPGSGGLEGA